MDIKPDSVALILLCAHLAMGDEDSLAPLTLREWNPIALGLRAHDQRPADLLSYTALDFQTKLGMNETLVDRTAMLLSRREIIEIELQRLESIGIGVITRLDADYPERFRQALRESSPPVLFFAGEQAVLGQPGIAVVGSRVLDPSGEKTAEFIGNACGRSGKVLYSGGAKGADTISMRAALEARGNAVAVLADSLERASRDPSLQPYLESGDLCLITPYGPNVGFSVGNAMGRNRLIYILGEYAIVIASDAGKGGTWSGATQAMKNAYAPVFVLEYVGMPEGNQELINMGAIRFPYPFPGDFEELKIWLQENRSGKKSQGNQQTLF